MPGALTGLRVLVADDDDSVRQGIIDVLETEGAEVVSAVNGIDALKLLANLDVNVVITDLAMPKMDGAEVVAHIRSDQRTALLPILVLSACIPESVKGATACLAKPFEMSELVKTIAAIADWSAAGGTSCAGAR